MVVSKGKWDARTRFGGRNTPGLKEGRPCSIEAPQTGRSELTGKPACLSTALAVWRDDLVVNREAGPGMWQYQMVVIALARTLGKRQPAARGSRIRSVKAGAHGLNGARVK